MHEQPSVIELHVVDGRPTIRGECDWSNADEIEAWLHAFGRGELEVDLSGVTFFDSAAIRSVLRVLKRNPTMRVVRPSPNVERVLKITGTYNALVDP
jgi:stage II sporulation protein AA (anti-sigma F factor antagonist)